MPQVFVRMLGEVLDNVPNLSSITQLNLEEARVICFDIDECAKMGSDKITALMYMLSRYASSKNFYLKFEDLEKMFSLYQRKNANTSFLEKYKQLHEQTIEELSKTPKRICFDEFHRVSKYQPVREQVVLDMREGRKWQVDVTLSTQSLKDFDELMVEFASGIFVMDGGSQKNIEEISKTLGFNSQDEMDALQHKVHGPKKGGGTFMAKFFTNQGQYTGLMTLSLSPMELWSFNTHHIDLFLRELLTKQIGFEKAIEKLAQFYPNGTCTADFEVLKQKKQETGEEFDFMNSMNVIISKMNL